MNCKKCGVPIPQSFFKKVCDNCIKENKEKLDEMKKEFMPVHKSFKMSTSKNAVRLSLFVFISFVLEEITATLWGSSWIRGLAIFIIIGLIIYYPVIKKMSKKENNIPEQKSQTE